MIDSKMLRPANYDKLTSTGQAIVDDHIRAGIQPPKMTPPSKKQLARTLWPFDASDLPED